MKKKNQTQKAMLLSYPTSMFEPQAKAEMWPTKSVACRIRNVKATAHYESASRVKKAIFMIGQKQKINVSSDQ